MTKREAIKFLGTAEASHFDGPGQMWNSKHEPESRLERTARRSSAFLAHLEKLCGRPEVDPEDTRLSLAIFDAAARAGLETPVGTDSPEWASKAFDILSAMRPNLPERHAGRVEHVQEADPALHACQMRARDFFFNSGILEAEKLLACCLMAYAEGWLPSLAWRDLEAPDFECRALVRDITSQLASKALIDSQVFLNRANTLLPAALAAGVLALIAGFVGSSAFLTILFAVLCVAGTMGARHARKKGDKFKSEWHAFASKAQPRRFAYSGAYPRITPPSEPPPPPRARGHVVEGPPCVMCGGTIFANTTTKPGVVLYGCTGCGQPS